jgi:TonB family protein
MFESKSLAPKSDRFLTSPSRRRAEVHQQRLMVVALVLLLAALGLLLYKDRDFWFPGTEEAQAQPETSAPTATIQPAQQIAAARSAAPAVGKNRRNSKTNEEPSTPASPSGPQDGTTMSRTVLPALEVEVVAGDVHRTIRPGTNSVRVDLQGGSQAQAVSVPSAPAAASDTAAAVTSKAAERVQISADAAEVVSQPVKPSYPLLARQMKVQGSVILQALVNRDGTIQDLHVLSGPPILASAAQEAVRQWRFKPHYVGSEAVETQAKITVNFTISTN